MPRDKDVKRVVRKRMAETGERYTEARAAIRPDVEGQSSAGRETRGHAGQSDLVDVEIPAHGGVRVQLATGQHYVEMKERAGNRSLPICIGMAEANAIAVPLTPWKVQRPLTADLMTSTIGTLGGEVERVVITRFESGCSSRRCTSSATGGGHPCYGHAVGLPCPAERGRLALTRRPAAQHSPPIRAWEREAGRGPGLSSHAPLCN